MPIIEELMTHEGVRGAHPLPVSEILDISAQFDCSLPDSLLALWSKTDGLELNQLDARILGTKEAFELGKDTGWLSEGLLPIIDDHRSNYCLIAFEDPLAARILHRPHDGDSRILYIDFENCLQAVLNCIHTDQDLDLMLSETDGDFGPNAYRSSADRLAAKALMRTDGKQNEWNLAAQLLSPEDIEEFRTLLETDHFIRRDVLARLRKMTSPALMELVRQDTAEFQSFTAQVVAAAKSNGLKVGDLRGHVLGINNAWINLEMFYHRRHIPDAYSRLVSWVKDLTSRRDPHSRPNNFFTD